MGCWKLAYKRVNGLQIAGGSDQASGVFATVVAIVELIAKRIGDGGGELIEVRIVFDGDRTDIVQNAIATMDGLLVSRASASSCCQHV